MSWAEGEHLKFFVGCDFEELKGYLRRIRFYERKEYAEELKAFLNAKLFNLIVWRKDGEIVGHAIWHESNTEEHRKDDPRDKEDREILLRLTGGKKDFVELHEVWLAEEHRRKGYGKKFFEFFEEFIRNRGYDSIIYYAYHPAAIAICRQRGYKEAYGIEETEPRGEVETCYVFYLPLKRT